jgi:precorrin-3B methylase
MFRLDIWAILLTYSMEQSPSWEANRFAASQEISRILYNPNAHRRIHKFPPPVSILSQLRVPGSIVISVTTVGNR